MNLTGTLIEVFEEQQISDKFRKREIVIEFAENPQYPEILKFQLVNDKCDIINDYKIGDVLDVHYNLRGNKWEKDGKTSYFVNLQAWKVESVIVQDSVEEFENKEIVVDEEDDLPF